MGTIVTELCPKVEVASSITISLAAADSLGNLLADPDWDLLVYELADRLDVVTDLLGLLGADLLLHLLTDRGRDRGADLLGHLLALLPWNLGGIVGAVRGAGAGDDHPPHVLPLALPLVLAPGQLVDALGRGVAASGLDVDQFGDLVADLPGDCEALSVLAGLALLSHHGAADVVVLSPAGGGRLTALLLLHLLVLGGPLRLKDRLTPLGPLG